MHSCQNDFGEVVFSNEAILLDVIKLAIKHARARICQESSPGVVASGLARDQRSLSGLITAGFSLPRMSQTHFSQLHNCGLIVRQNPACPL